GALHRALNLGALLASLDRGELRGGFCRSRRAAPDLTVIGHRDGAALLRSDAENHLAARRVAVLDRRILGLFLVRLVPAEAVFAGSFIAREGAVLGECRSGVCQYQNGGRETRGAQDCTTHPIRPPASRRWSRSPDGRFKVWLRDIARNRGARYRTGE